MLRAYSVGDGLSPGSVVVVRTSLHTVAIPFDQVSVNGDLIEDLHALLVVVAPGHLTVSSTLMETAFGLQPILHVSFPA